VQNQAFEFLFDLWNKPKIMPRGGPRPGSGRPKLLADRPRRLLQSEWATSAYGLPTKRFLFASNWWLSEVTTETNKPEGERDRAKIIEGLDQAMKYAAMAAPYIERRLASITHQVLPYDFSKLTDQELAELERIIRAATGAPSPGSTDEREAPSFH
jgi:hypothetical protein